MKKYRWFGLFVATVTIIFGVIPLVQPEEPAPEPQILTMVAGSTRLVADGRAQIWLGKVLDSTPNDIAIEFELNCEGQSFKGHAIKGSPGQTICGCRVVLLETLDTEPPSVRLQVSWTSDFTANLQAASQAVH